MNTSHVQIRLASLDDVDRLLDLITTFSEFLQSSVPPQNELQSALLFLLRDPMCDFAIATDNTGSSLAYIQIRYFYSLWSLGLEAKLEDLFVRPQVRRQGLGFKLLAFTLKRAHQRHCRLIALNTNENNLAALNLYRRQGFNNQPSLWQGGQQLWLEKSLRP